MAVTAPVLAAPSDPGSPVSVFDFQALQLRLIAANTGIGITPGARGFTPVRTQAAPLVFSISQALQLRLIAANTGISIIRGARGSTPVRTQAAP
ncbi:hypothetical protein MCOR02_000145 [Pyricularia oryzae]|nr:hypothetical protein MCOR02_000145 [Pyricularia oryzae]